MSMLHFRRTCLAGTAALSLTLGLAASASAAPPTVYLSPTGNDAAACTQAAPCKTFDRGYRVASPGSEVVLAAGNYGGQSLSNLPVKSSAEKVVFRPVAGASVSTGSLTISNSDNIEVRDVKTGGWGVTNGSAHVILKRVSANDVSFAAGYFSGADDVQLIDSEIARIDPDDGIHMNNSGGSNTNITIDGLYMHDLTINRSPSSHDDCIQTGDVNNLVIRNSRFVNCGTQGVFLNPYNGGVTKNIVIENNFFGQAQLGYNVLYIGDAVGVNVRNNSFVGQVYTYNPASFTHLKMTNNIFAGNDSYNCGQLATKSDVFSNNASTSSCSGAANHTVNANLSSQFVNPSGSNAATFDLHLKAGAAAIDKGGSDYSTTDYDRTARPSGSTPDIGADEYGAGSTPAPTPTPTPTPTPAPAPAASDKTAPTTKIISGTAGTTSSTNASFQFTGADETSAVTFECKLDSGAYSACTSPKAYTGVAAGSHVISVRAKDAAGNVDASPATWGWTVATGAAKPVAAYGFNETTGTTVADASGNGLTGTRSGATPTTGGKFGGALTFDGSSSLVTVADNAKLDLTKGMTLEAWVRPTNLSGWRTVMLKENGTQLAYSLYANSDTQQAGSWVFTTSEIASRGGSTLPLNAWSHLAATYDGTALRFLVNGVQVASQPLTASMAVTTGALRIGGNKTWGEYFAGQIDEVRVYNRALSASEVKTDMTKAI
jgi:hypothetical protein